MNYIERWAGAFDRPSGEIERKKREGAGARLLYASSMTEMEGQSMIYEFSTTASPVGELYLVASEKGLTGVLWGERDRARVRLGACLPNAGHSVLTATAKQLEEYFGGQRTCFDLPLDLRGTDFQCRVWSALLMIPFGEMRSYADIARKIGKPAASRAVGAANGCNPISIIAPCHRVIGSSGRLTGFAGGLSAKQYLLDHERLMAGAALV